jgi:hypothetical protein
MPTPYDDDALPAFEIGLPNDQCVKIYANGRVTGLAGIVSVINRIPVLIVEAYAKGREENNG